MYWMVGKHHRRNTVIVVNITVDVLRSTVKSNYEIFVCLSLCVHKVVFLPAIPPLGLLLLLLTSYYCTIYSFSCFNYVTTHLTYALPAWKGFVSIEQTNRINALLKRCYRYGYVVKIHCLSDLLNSVDLALFDKMHSKAHCLYPLLPPVRNQLEHLRSRGHDFTLPSCTKDLYKRSFVMRCLFNFM